MSVDELAVPVVDELDTTGLEESAPSEELETDQEEVTPEGETTEEETPKEEPKPKEKSNRFKKRINQVIGERYRETNRADGLQERVDELESQVQTSTYKAPRAPQESDPEIDYDPDKFQLAQDKYLEDKIDYQVQQSTAKQRQEEQNNAAQNAEQKVNDEYADRVEKSGLKDYSAVINDLQMVLKTSKVSGVISEVILTADDGPKIGHYLGKNLEVAEKIARMSHSSAVLELGKISAGLSAKKTVKTTQTPDPVKTAKSGGGSMKSIEKMAMGDIMKDSTI